MKIIHCGDLHLDSKMESNLTKDQAKLRKKELLDAFERMVTFAKTNGVEVIMIAGDMFDKTHVKKEARNRVWEQIKAHPEIDFCYLKGNHDKCDFLSEEQLELVSNFHTFSQEQWTSYEYGDVVISGIELDKTNVNTLGANLVLEQDKFNIVLLHGQEVNYQGKDSTQVIHLTALQNKFIDYLALGHIHSYKQEALDERGIYCYCGCLEGRGFDECGEKGFVLLEIENKKLTTTFVVNQGRQFHEVELEVDESMDMLEIMSQIEKKVEHISSEDAVKFVIKGVVDFDFDVDLDRIKDRFMQRFFFVKCYDKTRVAIRYEDFLQDRSLKGEFVRLLQRQQELSEDERSEIIEIGLHAIMGEEIEE